MDSKFFKITYYNLMLEVELFTIDYIEKKLEDFVDKDLIHRLRIPEKNLARSFKQIYIDADNKERYHFFAYIKFFKYEGQEYGLVGGKTNYPRPDVSFNYQQDEQKDKRIARIFLSKEGLKWHDEIIIVNHKPDLDKQEDNQQAIFLETFLQRQFNLFNS